MNIKALIKLEMLVANKEATLVETLERHDKALRHYDTQRTILANYQARMASAWQNGTVVLAGDAGRAATFSAQAEDARQHLAHAITTQKDKRSACATELSTLHIHHKALQERLQAARQEAFNQAEDRAERSRIHRRKPDQTDDQLF